MFTPEENKLPESEGKLQKFDLFEDNRSLLTAYAYAILGSVDDAKDIVQDAFLKIMFMDNAKIRDTRSYLIRTVINLSINKKNKNKKLQAGYPGEWLPEPVATETADALIKGKEVLEYSLMVLLEKLNARQRAVFILKEAFDYEHTEIAEVLEIKPDYSRQLLKRAKKNIEGDGAVTKGNSSADYLNTYLEVIRRGDTARLEELLKEEIIVYSDGGGKVSAGLKPVYGKKHASAYLLGIYQKFYRNRHIVQGIINHQPALLYYEDNVLTNCQIFSLESEHIKQIYFIRNPEKLKVI
ncbi:sigma-70 family RNA polymerase sigma factor [Rubrolithibacter danxiaensis]|uniref:sigma-70 family RNA polymerase sigma factor n=1 Tax=Rubrolithibacter danxiaensis TaxID=3390805 RepID=UPI003BF80708